MKKRVSLHEKNAKELSEKLKESEKRHGLEIDQVRAFSEERLGELIFEKSELKEKVHSLEKDLYQIKRERDTFQSENVAFKSEKER